MTIPKKQNLSADKGVDRRTYSSSVSVNWLGYYENSMKDPQKTELPYHPAILPLGT